MCGKRYSAINMSIGWTTDMIVWACAQPFPTLAMPLLGAY